MNFRSRLEKKQGISLDMTPLIDMVFQLLIFFLLTTTFAVNVKESGLEVDLPRAKSTQISSMPSHIVVAILKDGRMVVGGETLSEEMLEHKFTELSEHNPNAMVIVQADQMVEHWRVVRVLDLGARTGLKKLAIATVEN